ncbi:MAG: YraN family protein [Nocardioides sp.]|uniref:YraN family protein n=1 Tax=Nocardioides sp. TaxID=35761 RepID=UPI0039E34893
MGQSSIGVHNQALGRYGERVAVRRLVADGLHLLDRNWRCGLGELDLVMREGRVLVAVEVKTRTSTLSGMPHEAVDEVKLARLRQLAARWQEERGIRAPEVRIDLVAVLLARKGAPTIEHVRGIG